MEENSNQHKLADALRRLVHEKGELILLDSQLINVLSDYQVLSGNTAAKNIIKSLQKSGYMTKILQIQNWNLESKSLCTLFAKQNGFQTNLVQSIVCSIGYSLAKTDTIDIADQHKNQPKIDLSTKSIRDTPVQNTNQSPKRKTTSATSKEHSIDKKKSNSGCCGYLIIFLVIGLMVGALNKCNGDSSQEEGNTQKSTNDSVFFLPRTVIDTIKDSKGAIVNMKEKEVSDVKLSLADDTLYLETPYVCTKPSLSFRFDNAVFNHVTGKLQHEHEYTLLALNTNDNRHVYYLLKNQLPKIEYEDYGYLDNVTKENFHPIESMEISYPRGKFKIFDEGEILISDYISGYSLSDSLKIKLFDYLVIVKNK